MMISLSVSVMYVYKYFSKALSLEGKVKSMFKGPSATQSWSEGKSSKGAATFHFMVDKTSSRSLINDTGKQNDSLPVFSFLFFLFFSLLGWTVQKCFLRPQRKTLCDCKRLLYEALKPSHPHTLDPAEQENKALFWKWFLKTKYPPSHLTGKGINITSRKGYVLFLNLRLHLNFWQHNLIPVFQYAQKNKSSISQWVMRCQVVFIQNISFAVLGVVTCCWLWFSFAEGSSSTMHDHGAQSNALQTVSPHLGNALAELLSVHCNWLTVPCIFPDVGFSFSSTCLTYAKTK